MAGPRKYFGQCLGCDQHATFLPIGRNGALVCQRCNVEYPPNLYPKPNAAAGLGNAVFKGPDGPIIFTDDRPMVPRPYYARTYIEHKGSDGKWTSERDFRQIMDGDTIKWVERSASKVSRDGPVVTAIVPRNDAKNTRWRVRYTDNVDSALSLNRRRR